MKQSGSSEGAAASPQGPELLDTFLEWLIRGRWLLVAAETAETVLLLAFSNVTPAGCAALLSLFAYNLLSLFVVRRVVERRGLLAAMLATDLCWVALVASQTGGTDSSFLGQCYLIIFAAALAYGRRGALLVSVVSVVITLSMVFVHPQGFLEDVRDLIPYFLVAGLFTGYLSERLHTAFRLRLQSEALARQREIEAEGNRREMSLARAMQMAVLPREPPAFPGYELAARLEYASDVGGDFYLFLRGDDHLGVVVGDVCGKGMPAALAATSISHLLPWLHGTHDPPQAMRSLNRHLGERLPEGSFVTLALVVLDPEGGVTHLSAGHPPPLVWRAAEARVIELTGSGPLLGMLDEWDGDPQDARLDVGDVVLLYTDGLTETRSPLSRELFATERAAAVLAENAERPLDEILTAMLDTAAAWGTTTDDVTVVAVRYVGDGR